MTIELTETNGIALAEIHAGGVVIATAQDALEVLANCGYQGARKIIVQQKNLIPEFFDLSTGIAGEVLPKFSTYDGQLAIVGDFSGYPSNRRISCAKATERVASVSYLRLPKPGPPC